MSDLPGLSGDMGAGKPLSRAEFARRERERKALQLFIEGKSYAQIKNALNLRNTDAAREQVRLGEARWIEEEEGALTRHRAAMRSDLMEMRTILVEMSRTQNLAAMDRLVKVWERMAKLDALDKERETGEGIEITLIDARPPWDRGETIDSTGEDDPPALPAKT